jgi:ribosomal protein S18 acetylase RimI-like enzyme
VRARPEYARCVQIAPLRDDERTWLAEVIRERWGGEPLVGRGRARALSDLTVLVARDDEDERVGVASYVIEGDGAELVTLDALREGEGVGTALVAEVVRRVRAAGCRRLEVMTTNDNLRALRLYQRSGFRISGLRPGAIEQARTLKPSIPRLGYDGIPIADEIDLVMEL